MNYYYIYGDTYKLVFGMKESHIIPYQKVKSKLIEFTNKSGSQKLHKWVLQ